MENATAYCAAVKQRMVREAGTMKHGTTVIAFLRDPDGYLIELIQKKSST